MVDQRDDQQDYTPIIAAFNHKFSVLDTTAVAIENTASDFLEQIEKTPQLINDLIQLWIRFAKESRDRLPFIYVSSEIIGKSAKQNKTYKTSGSEGEGTLLSEIFYPYVVDLFSFLYSTFNEKLQKGIDEIISVWEQQKIYSQKQIDALRFNISLSTFPSFSGTPEQNELLFEKIINGTIHLDDSMCEYSKELDILKTTNDNKHRENVLKMTKEFINKQNKIYYTHVHYIQVLDKMLDKIKAYKDYNKGIEDIENSNLR